MADHAVGGVDRLVGGAPGEPERCEPEHRRNHPIREILGKTFDRGAGDAGLVERVRIAADDLRHRAAAAFEPRVFTSQFRATVNSWNAPSIRHLFR